MTSPTYGRKQQIPAAGSPAPPGPPAAGAASAPRRVVPDVPAPLPDVALLIVLLFVFLTLSRFHEVITLKLGTSLFVYMGTAGAALGTAALTGRLFNAFESLPGKLFLGFTVWMMIGLPFAIWKGGTFSLLTNIWPPSLATFVIVGGLIGRIGEFRRVIYVAGFSLVFVVLLFVAFGVEQHGRMALGFGAIANSNDLAVHILVSVPFLVFVLIDQKRFSLLRLCAVPTLAAALFVVSRTGSRTGLLGIAVMIGAAFVLMPMRDRIKLSLVAAAVGILFVTAASDRLIERYKTMFTDSAKDESAKMSTESRMWVMKESFRQMLRHPVFGVGPGNFTVASADTKRSIGLSFRLYENAHNTYGQVASETGVPGFVMFCSIVLWSLHQNLKLYRRVRSHPAYARIKRLAFSLFVSLTGFSVMAFFGNYPYLFYLPLLSGLTVSLARAANAEIRLRESAVPAAARRPATPVWGR